MPCRDTRDQIIKSAIEQARVPNWEVHDMPDQVVLPHAFAIDWLQDAIDFWHHHVPFSATVRKLALTLPAQADTITLPSDFIVDVRNGLRTRSTPGDPNSMRRRIRLPFQKFLNRKEYNQNRPNIQTPLWYCIVGDDGLAPTQYQTMMVDPIPSITVVAELWYYSLPGRIEANQRPKLPSDYVGKEYVKLRGLENYRLIDIGTSYKFGQVLIQTAKANGLLNEPEDDEIPLDELTYVRSGGLHYSSYGWMGAV